MKFVVDCAYERLVKLLIGMQVANRETRQASLFSRGSQVQQCNIGSKHRGC